MTDLTQAELEVLLAYAVNHKNYRSMTIEENLKRRGLLQWKDGKFSSGQLEISPAGRLELQNRGIVA